MVSDTLNLGEGDNVVIAGAGCDTYYDVAIAISSLAITVSWFGRLQVLSKVLQLLI